MKKAVNISLILVILIICIMGNVYAAINCKISMHTSKNEFKQGEEFVVDVKLSNLQSERGIIAFGATLEYDKQSLTLVKMEGKNGWSTPSYSEVNGKLVMERNGFATKDEILFQITFKFNEKSDKNVLITLKNLEVADGNERSKLGETSITIKGKNQGTDVGEDNKPSNNNSGNNKPGNNNSGNNNLGNNKPGDNNPEDNNTTEDENQNTNVTPIPNPNTNTEKNTVIKDNSVSDTKIPNSGNNYRFILILLAVVLIFVIVLILRSKKIRRR